MQKELIIRAFEHAKELKKKEGNNKPSSEDLAKKISNFVHQEEGILLGERSYRNYYNEARQLRLSKKDISIKQGEVVKGLCKFLGFENYEDFAKNLKTQNESIGKNLKIVIQENKIFFAIFLALAVCILLIASLNRQRWMLWNETHYEEVKFSTEELSKGRLKTLNEGRIENFQRIVPNCSTEFYKGNGQENLWYGKNRKGELQFFTDLGLHPETGKTLKPITEYMIRKYVCESYK